MEKLNVYEDEAKYFLEKGIALAEAKKYQKAANLL